jgi:hypothetical protein
MPPLAAVAFALRARHCFAGRARLYSGSEMQTSIKAMIFGRNVLHLWNIGKSFILINLLRNDSACGGNMHRHLVLFILAVFLFAASGISLFALDFEVRGEYRNRGVLMLNKDANSDTRDNFSIFDSRFRLWFEPVVSSNLRFVYNLQVGDISWGDLVGVPRKDKNHPYSGGGTQGTEGVNLQTRQMYAKYTDGDTLFNIGFIPFSTPLAFVMSSNIPGIHFRTKFLGLNANLMYARAYAGPGDVVHASKSADTIDLSDDRNDYFFSLDREFGSAVHLTAWVLYDDNGRFRERGGADGKQLESELFYWGIQSKGELSPVWSYSADFVLNTGTITSHGEGSEKVEAFAFRALGKANLGEWTIQFQGRLLSGNKHDDTKPGTPVRQFTVLDGDEGPVGSWMGILFGGGPFDHQSYFHHSAASARRKNISTGYFVRDDPGITSLEFRIERAILEKTTLLLSGGYARTTRAVLDSDGKKQSSLGTEVDIGLKHPVTEGLELYIQLGYLFPGPALGPTIALDGGDRPAIGTDPVMQVAAMLSLKF